MHMLDQAKRLIELSGRQPSGEIDIVFTGVRQGEKLFEGCSTAARRSTRRGTRRSTSGRSRKCHQRSSKRHWPGCGSWPPTDRLTPSGPSWPRSCRRRSSPEAPPLGPPADADRSRAGPYETDLLTRVLAAIPEGLHHLPLMGGDVDRLWHAAAMHRVDLPLAVWLRRPGLESALAAERLWRKCQLKLLHEIQDALEAHGIEAVSLKGPVLVERIYADGAGRGSADLDILVTEGELDPTLEVLHGMGFRRLGRDLPLAAERTHVIEIGLDRSGREDVEVHFRFSVLFGRLVGSESALSRKTRYRTTLGHDVWLLTPEDEFLFLALHAAKHAFHPLYLLFELKLFVVRYPCIDWDAVSERARTMSVQTAVWAAARALFERLAFDVPLRCLRLRPSLVAQWLWDLERNMASATLSPLGLHGWLRHHADYLLLCDNTWRRMAYVRQQVGRGFRWRLAARMRGESRCR